MVILRAWLFGTILLAAGSAYAQPSAVFASPMHVYLSARPGETVTRTIRVTSDSNNPVETSHRVLPFTIDIEGQPSHESAGKRDLQPWLQVTRSSPTVDRKHPLEMALHIAVPATAHGSYWTSVVLESSADANGVRVGLLIAIPVVVNVGGSVRCEIRDVVAVATDDGFFVITATIHSFGEIAIRSPLGVSIERREVELASIDSPPFLLLPGGVRRVTVRIPRGSIELGDLVAKVFFSTGREIAAGHAAIR